MPDKSIFDGVEDELVNLIKPVERDGLLGYYIDGAMRVIDPANPGFYFVRFPDKSWTRAANTRGLGAEFNAPVTVRRNAKGIDEIIGPALQQISGVVDTYGFAFFILPHTHSIDDITTIGNGTPTLNYVLVGDGTLFQSIALGVAINNILTGLATGAILRTAPNTFEVADPSTFGFDSDQILVDDDGVILIDDDGNVILGEL